MVAEYRVDLIELDPIAADLDLVVDPSQKSDLAVRKESPEIAGSIQAAAFVAERIGQEPFGGEVRPVPITASDSGAADVNFASRALWNFAAMFVEDVNTHIIDGPTDRGQPLARFFRTNGSGGRDDRALGGTIVVDERKWQARAVDDDEACRRR